MDSQGSALTQVLVYQFRQHGRLWRAGLSDLTEEPWLREPAEGLNPLAFLAVHILESRYSIAKFVGVEQQSPLPESVRKARKAADIEAYPSVTEMLAAWNAVDESVPRALMTASESWLLEPMQTRIPMQIERRLDMLGFLAHHEAYHLGQMGSARRALGLPPLLDALRTLESA